MNSDWSIAVGCGTLCLDFETVRTLWFRQGLASQSVSVEIELLLRKTVRRFKLSILKNVLSLVGAGDSASRGAQVRDP